MIMKERRMKETSIIIIIFFHHQSSFIIILFVVEERERKKERRATVSHPHLYIHSSLFGVGSQRNMEGVWIRFELKRKRNGWKSHTTSDVRYLQTRSGYFIDVRREKEEKEEIDMAFAGISRWEIEAEERMNVKWYAFFDLDKDFYKKRTNLSEDWNLALKTGKMRPTDDVGVFVSCEKETDDRWIETDPENTLSETWKRISTGDGKFLAVLSKDKTVMLVIVGEFWSVAIDGRGHEKRKERTSSTIVTYATGRIQTHWIVDSSVGDDAKKLLIRGGSLVLPGRSRDDYEVQPGSTLDWSKDIPSLLFLDTLSL
jgi:hypothetical protein